MTVIQLQRKLAIFCKKGYGNYPVQIFGIEDYMPFADDIASIEVAKEYDGERVWINESASPERHGPEWFHE